MDTEAEVSLPAQEPASAGVGTSKKQQRIADIVKAQLREELVEVLETRLEQLAAERGSASEADAPAQLQVLEALQHAGLERAPGVQQLLQQAQGGEPQAELSALADLASLALARMAQVGRPAPRASRAIPPGGAGAAAPDARREYARRLAALRPGDLGALLELKREFRKRGLEVY
ncbi:MAG TPA: hypothetical protein PLC52_04885 [Anaerolineales bacterium]|nr:hypothetical protein [Anaerolineales bacterium]HRQ92185.1 hypothetical protein [Anaerolineales bacterium]